MKFPPINLWSKPHQLDLEQEMAELRVEVAKFKHGDSTKQMYLSLLAAERLKELEFIYYCRNGVFPDER